MASFERGLRGLSRGTKQLVNRYSLAETKIREATKNDPSEPSTALMADIAEMTYNTQSFKDIMSILWRRMNDDGRNWLHVYKSLTVLEYLLRCGTEKVVRHCQDNKISIETLKCFQHEDKSGHDCGHKVREKAKALVSLLKDGDRLKEERERGRRLRERLYQFPKTSGSTGSSTSDPSPAGSVSSEALQQAMSESLQLHQREEKLRQQEEDALEAAIKDSLAECGVQEQDDPKQKDNQNPSATLEGDSSSLDHSSQVKPIPDPHSSTYDPFNFDLFDGGLTTVTSSSHKEQSVDDIEVFLTDHELTPNQVPNGTTSATSIIPGANPFQPPPPTALPAAHTHGSRENLTQFPWAQQQQQQQQQQWPPQAPPPAGATGSGPVHGWVQFS